MNTKVLRTPDAARYIGLGKSTLEKMRVSGSGPAFVKLGSRTVGYALTDLDRWLETRQRLTSTSEIVRTE